MAMSFDQIFAADPANPQNVASNAAVLIYAPGDATKAPLTITDPSGGPLANPVIVNANGFGSAFMHATLDRVAWDGGGFSGFFTSYEGMKNVSVAAQAAAEAAAATAGVDAAAVATAAIGDATADADAAAASAAASATAAANAAATANAPTDTAMAAAINGTGATKTALNATFDRAFEPSTSIVYDGVGNVTSSTEGGITTTYTYNADGSVHTETRQGKVRTWAYDGNGNPTSSTVV